MKNKGKTTACLLLAVLLIAAGITYNPISACAGSYKKSVSKKITIDPDKYCYIIAGTSITGDTMSFTVVVESQKITAKI